MPTLQSMWDFRHIVRSLFRPRADALAPLCSWMPIDTFLADGQQLSAKLGVTDVVSAVAIPAPSPGDVYWSHKACHPCVSLRARPMIGCSDRSPQRCCS